MLLDRTCTRCSMMETLHKQWLRCLAQRTLYKHPPPSVSSVVVTPTARLPINLSSELDGECEREEVSYTSINIRKESPKIHFFCDKGKHWRTCVWLVRWSGKPGLQTWIYWPICVRKENRHYLLIYENNECTNRWVFLRANLSVISFVLQQIQKIIAIIIAFNQIWEQNQYLDICQIAGKCGPYPSEPVFLPD